MELGNPPDDVNRKGTNESTVRPKVEKHQVETDEAIVVMIALETRQ